MPALNHCPRPNPHAAAHRTHILQHTLASGMWEHTISKRPQAFVPMRTCLATFMRFQMTLQVLVMLLVHIDAIPTLALRTVTQATAHVALDCPICTCTSPAVWPFSGCDVSCGAKCDDECCCIAGVGSCPPVPPPTPPTPPDSAYTPTGMLGLRQWLFMCR